METGYQRGKIQEESLTYERRKHDGSYPIVGVEHLPQPARRRGTDGSRAGCAVMAGEAAAGGDGRRGT